MGTVNPAPAADWLQQLAPAHAPPPVAWWPVAPGWWALLLLFLAACVALYLWLRNPQRRLRRAALHELAKIESTTVGDAALASAVEHLVRRYALARHGHAAVAGLSGERWMAFAIAHGASAWQGATGTALLQAAYGGSAVADRARWVAGARAFLKARK